MIHRCILGTLLIASAFWSAGATGRGSLRGLGIFEETQTIVIDVEVSDSIENILSVLQGPIFDALNGEFLTLTGNDADSGTMEVSLEVDNSGGRKLGRYSYVGSCRRCSSSNSDRRVLTAGFSGALKSAVKQWCKDNGKACDGKAIKSISYDLS
jgi:hypothetical protein